MPKLNLGKVVGDKGDPFVFEDFTPEQLDGLTPKMLKGNVTTLDPDQNATVDIRKEGLNNYIDFGIPRGKNGSELKNISAENVEMADGNTLESAMAETNESIAGIEEPIFDDAVDTYATLAESNTAAETTSNAIRSHTSIFSTLSNMKKSLSAIVQGLKILGKNVGMIDGITSDLNSGTEYTAASIKAVSALNSNLALEEIPLTSLGGCKLYKSGHLRVLLVSIANTEYTNGKSLGRIPAVHAPLNAIYAPFVATGSLTKISVYLTPGLSINLSGDLQISGVTGTGNIYASILWVK